MSINKVFIVGIIFLTGILSGHFNALSQVLTLDSVLNTIELNRAELRMYDSRINAYQAYSEGARSLDAPQLGVGFFMTPYNPTMWKSDPEMNTNGMGSLMFSSQQMFMNPKKLDANAEYMKSMSGVELEMKNSMKNELFSMAKMNYYELVILKKKIRILNESEAILNYLIQSTELKYNYGMDKLNSYYKAKGMLGDIQSMKIMTVNEIDQKMVEINTLMNRDKTIVFDVDTLLVYQNYETKMIDSSTISLSRSDFKLITQNENVLRTKQEYENSKRLPDFGIKYDHMLTFGTQPQQFSLMAMVSIPIVPWSSKMYKSNVKGLTFEIESLKWQQQAFVNEVNGTLENLKIKMKSKKQQIELNETVIIPSLKRNYEVALLAYNQNNEELFMVLDAWQNLKLAQLSLLDQIMELLLLQTQFENQLEIK